jgi:RNA polymerase sigma-70 factor (ECF subfamily)
MHLSLEDQDAADHSDPLGEAGASEMEARLQKGLGELPRLQREVFLLRAQQGMDYKEICSTLGTTPGAARVHYHHAVKRLKELMQ